MIILNTLYLEQVTSNGKIVPREKLLLREQNFGQKVGWYLYREYINCKSVDVFFNNHFYLILFFF